MKIIIVGAGNVGKELVSRLSEEGHDIVVVDSNEKRLNNFIDRHDVMGIAGNGADFDVLENAGVNTADLFVACTPQDEISSFFPKKPNNRDGYMIPSPISAYVISRPDNGYVVFAAV